MSKIDKKKKIGYIFKLLLKISISVIVIYYTFSVCLAICFTSWKDVKINNLNIYYSNVMRNCIVGSYEWDGDTDNMTFIVPDEYEGFKVKSLGGVPGMAPTMFSIRVPEDMHPEIVGATESEDCAGIIDENTVTYSFTVKLGKNIKNFEYFAYKEYYTDENDKVIYIVEVKYECSPENKWVYSQDGKLYNKRTNELIE